MGWDGPKKDMGYFPSSTFLNSWISLLLKNRKCKTTPLGVLGLGESSCSRVASRRWDAKTHADSSFGQVPKHTANQSSRHLSVKSGGRQSGAAPKSRDGGVMMAPQQAVSVWLICIGVAYVWGHGGEALDELSVVWSLKDGMKPWEISDQDNLFPVFNKLCVV